MVAATFERECARVFICLLARLRSTLYTYYLSYIFNLMWLRRARTVSMPPANPSPSPSMGLAHGCACPLLLLAHGCACTTFRLNLTCVRVLSFVLLSSRVGSDSSSTYSSSTSCRYWSPRPCLPTLDRTTRKQNINKHNANTNTQTRSIKTETWSSL